MQKTIGVLVAMSVEYRQVAAMMHDAETVQSGPQEFLIGIVGESRVVLLQSGIGKMARRNKALVDEVSATIILQGWMERRH